MGVKVSDLGNYSLSFPTNRSGTKTIYPIQITHFGEVGQDEQQRIFTKVENLRGSLRFDCPASFPLACTADNSA
jgi:hypothetical protein